MSSAAPASTAATLILRLDRFEGPIDLLLELARTQKVDLASLSIRALIDQYLAAVNTTRHRATLATRGDWLIAASALVLLKSKLLIHAEDETAVPEAERLRNSLVLAGQQQHARALAGWLEQRPQLGREVFARGAPEPGGRTADTEKGDLLDLLLACFDLLAPPVPGQAAAQRYTPKPLDLATLAEALQRLQARLQERPAGGALHLLRPPPWPKTASALRRRSTVACTFLAALELTREGLTELHQERPFGTVYLQYQSNPANAATADDQASERRDVT